MSNRVHVVVWGTNRPVAGALIVEPERVASARRGGAVLLPVDRDLLAGPFGWTKREYGPGVECPTPTPSRFCPIAIRIDPSRPFVHWAVELRDVSADGSSVPTDNPGAPSGSLRLGFDTSLPGTIAPQTSGGGAPIDVGRLVYADGGRNDPGFFATAIGVLRTSVSIEGLLGLSLYGAATGVRVRRVAVSVCSTEEP